MQIYENRLTYIRTAHIILIGYLLLNFLFKIANRLIILNQRFT